MQTIPHYSHFEIDIVSALASQLSGALDSLEIGQLSRGAIDDLPELRGVYQLFLNGASVYVGKADNLPRRLRMHHHKISGRNNITVDEMGFKCLSIHENWAALAPEKSLIDHYKSRLQSEWNGIGFGNNDPGRNRDLTDVDPEGFDMRYPIRLDWQCDWIEDGEWDVTELLVALKDSSKLPYLLRYYHEGHYKRGHSDYRGKTVTVPKKGMTSKELLVLITKALPGWQATAFPSHLILYPEDHAYKHGTVLHRQPI
ncbi:GIY-YIG nuclease family protein [Halomonas denitrificans]|uniref:GIY-YIG nuclease family protein n=1 Tax=Halomonas denitrificans TaxID=370769 RepID=UPI00130088C4|nr:GIY-YIG nuclease family protein [Halomonas denitrificans]